MSSHTISPILLENAAVLKSWTLDTQSPITYNHNSWRRFLSGNNAFEQVCRRFPDKVSRSDIRTLSAETWTHPSISKIHQLFIASMIWGFGTVGYGAYRTAKMFTTPDIDSILLKVFGYVQSEDLESAYQSLRISWCGPAFFTKFLYFAGLGGNLSMMPLILDSLVANGLENICDQSQVAFLKVNRYDNGKINFVLRDWEAYFQYLNLLHHWSHELSVRPDSLEYFLFSSG